MTHNDSLSLLTPRQRRAIIAIVTTATVDAAAKKAHISRRTLHRYLQESDFIAAVEAAYRDSYYEAMRKTQSAAVDAVATLSEILTDKTAKGADRVASARTLLEHGSAVSQRLERQEAERLSAERKARDPLQIVNREITHQLTCALARDAGIPLARLFRGRES